MSKYLGESVTGIEIGKWNLHSGSCMIGLGGIGWGCLQMHRQVGMTLLCMHKEFSYLNEEADNHDIIS